MLVEQRSVYPIDDDEGVDGFGCKSIARSGLFAATAAVAANCMVDLQLLLI